MTTWFNKSKIKNLFITTHKKNIDFVFVSNRVLKSKFKFFTKDFMTIVDRLKFLLNKQYDNYLTNLNLIKMNIAINLFRNLMRNLIDYVTFHALSKIRKQWKFVWKIEKYSKKHSLKSYIDAFNIIMRLLCVHQIKIRMNAMKNEFEKLLLKNVNNHWMFKKIDDKNFDKVVINASSNFFYQFEHIDDDFFLMILIFLMLTIFYTITTITSNCFFFFDEFEISNVNDVLNVNEFKVMKRKKRSRKSQNKKSLMIRIEKKTIKFTKRNLFDFEIVEKNIEQ